MTLTKSGQVKMTRLQIKAERELQHAFKLWHIFPKAKWDPNDPNTPSPKSLMFQLATLEYKAHKLAEDQCNKPLAEGYVERHEKLILKALDELLDFTALKIPVFLNGDPRGYALKIEDEYVKAHNLDIHKDWGGYGILRPDFSEG